MCRAEGFRVHPVGLRFSTFCVQRNHLENLFKCSATPYPRASLYPLRWGSRAGRQGPALSASLPWDSPRAAAPPRQPAATGKGVSREVPQTPPLEGHSEEHFMGSSERWPQWVGAPVAHSSDQLKNFWGFSLPCLTLWHCLLEAPFQISYVHSGPCLRLCCRDTENVTPAEPESAFHGRAELC